MSLSAEQHDLLEWLASDPRGDSKEALVFVHHFDRDTIASIIRAGPATEERHTVKAGGKMIEVARVRITAAGRDDLADQN